MCSGFLGKLDRVGVRCPGLQAVEWQRLENVYYGLSLTGAPAAVAAAAAAFSSSSSAAARRPFAMHDRSRHFGTGAYLISRRGMRQVSSGRYGEWG